MGKTLPLPTLLKPGLALLACGEEIRFSSVDADLVMAYRWNVRVTSGREGTRYVLRNCSAAEQRAGSPGVVYLAHAIAARLEDRPLVKGEDFVIMEDGDPLNLVRSNIIVQSKSELYNTVPPCPVSYGRLRELYEGTRTVKPMSINQLKNALAPFMGAERPTQYMIQHWMKEAGIRQRTAQEAQRVWKHTMPDKFQSMVEKAAETRKAMGKENRGNLGNPEALKSRKARRALVQVLRPKWEATHLKRVCPWCDKEFERQGCLVRRTEARGAKCFCSRSCAGKYHAQKHFVARVTGKAMDAEALPTWLTEAMEKTEQD